MIEIKEAEERVILLAVSEPAERMQNSLWMN